MGTITFDWNQVLAIFTITVSIAALIGGAYKLQSRSVSHSKSIKRLFDFKDEHERDANTWRTKYAEEMAELRGQVSGLAMANGKEFAAILERIERMEDAHNKQFERLEGKIDRLEERRKS